MFKQKLQQKSNQKISPTHIQLMKLVQLPTLAFEERVIHEIEENPALIDNNKNEINENNDEKLEEFFNNNSQEENKIVDTSEINIDEYLSDDEIPDYRKYLYNDNIYSKKINIQKTYSLSFYEYLKEQLHTFRLSREEFIISDFILGNLDKNGYLRSNISSLVEDLCIYFNINTNSETLETLLKKYIQKLDPSGVGARNLEECLIIQLNNKKTKDPKYIIAKKIIKECFKNFSKKHYLKIQKFLNISKEDLKEAILIITKLNPRPGNVLYDDLHNFKQIIPDFTINFVNGNLELLLNNKNIPELKISNSYIEMFKSYKYSKKKSKQQKNTVLFIKQKLDSAKYFIEALKQREQTLLLTMNTIMQYQKEYFCTGDEEKIKPMILKDIANKIKMDISTVSRVINSKYVSTPYGLLLVKDLFSEGMINCNGKKISTIEIKKNLFEIISSEDKKNTPLTDEELTFLLQNKGYIISRRTVTKYREKLNIPVSRLRIIL